MTVVVQESERVRRRTVDRCHRPALIALRCYWCPVRSLARSDILIFAFSSVVCSISRLQTTTVPDHLFSFCFLIRPFFGYFSPIQWRRPPLVLFFITIRPPFSLSATVIYIILYDSNGPCRLPQHALSLKGTEKRASSIPIQSASEWIRRRKTKG